MSRTQRGAPKDAFVTDLLRRDASFCIARFIGPDLEYWTPGGWISWEPHAPDACFDSRAEADQFLESIKGV